MSLKRSPSKKLPLEFGLTGLELKNAQEKDKKGIEKASLISITQW